jgi:epothilone polyketide synthase E
VEQLPYLADHRIYDRLVLPTTVGLEAAIAAGQAVFGTSELQLHHLTYHEAMVMADEAPRLVQVLLTPQGPRRAAFALLSTALPAAGTAKGRDDWRRHMSGVLQQDPSGGAPETGSLEPFSAAAVQARCLQQVTPEHYYWEVSRLPSMRCTQLL